MRVNQFVTMLSAGSLAAMLASTGLAQTTQPVERNDVLFGANRANAADTTHQVRNGVRLGSTWSAPFMESMQFDNFEGFRHAHFGNLIGVNFGTAAAGGSIFNLETRRTTTMTTPGIAQPIFDFATYNGANPGAPLTITRLNGLSISPKNNRMVVTGSDVGNTFVFDYTPGNGEGAGAALVNGRQITNLPNLTNSGTEWLDNDNVLVLDPAGPLHKVTIGAGGVLSDSVVANVTLPGAGNNPFSSLVYEPTISPFVYAAVGKFDGASISKVVVLDPNNSFAVVKSLDYSTSINTMREAAFDSKGNLLISHFMNTTSVPPGATIAILANARDPNTLVDNTSAEYYTQPPGFLSSQFNGMDVASTQLDYIRPDVTVNVRDRRHVQYYFGATAPLAQFRTKIQAGYNGGAWNGVGIISSNADATHFAVGYADAANVGLVGQPFGGETVSGNAVLTRLTRYGDANIDGAVNLSDFNRLASSFGQSGKFWQDGDFNYDGTVNLGDFNLLAGNFGLSAAGSEVTPQDWANLAAAIPEPSSLGLLATAGLLASRKRRR
jgi:hypothetical protein